MTTVTLSEASGLTLEQAYDLCRTKADAKALGFTCPRGHRTVLLNEYYAQPGRNYLEALRDALRWEPPSETIRGRAGSDVERALVAFERKVAA